MSFGSGTREAFRETTVVADRATDGGQPSGFPESRRAYFELHLALNPATALGREVSPLLLPLLARADEVIE